MSFAKFYLIGGEGLELVTMATFSKLQQSYLGCRNYSHSGGRVARLVGGRLFILTLFS